MSSPNPHDRDLSAAFDGQAARFERAPVQTDAAALASDSKANVQALVIANNARGFAPVRAPDGGVRMRCVRVHVRGTK